MLASDSGFLNTECAPKIAGLAAPHAATVGSLFAHLWLLAKRHSRPSLKKPIANVRLFCNIQPFSAALH
jgi:hypothetical protein